MKNGKNINMVMVETSLTLGNVLERYGKGINVSETTEGTPDAEGALRNSDIFNAHPTRDVRATLRSVFIKLTYYTGSR